MLDHFSISREPRVLGAAFALCGAACLMLMLNHPRNPVQTFPDLLKSEAQNQFVDAFVHGGFMVTLGVLAVCMVLLGRRLGSTKVSVVIGLMAFLAGCAVLAASMTLDGLVTPALAARFAGTDNAEDLHTAKTLFILLGMLIRFLMPIGFLLQFIAMFSLSSVVVRNRGLARLAGVFGLLAALIWAVALTAAPAALAMHVALGGILLQAIWYLMLSTVLFRGDSAAWIAVEERSQK
jgi:hypothetical protein